MRRSVVLGTVGRIVLLVGLLLSAMAPAAIPAAADNAIPAITFSPTSIAVGGSVTVSGSGFPCQTTITVDLLDSTGTQFVTSLGTVRNVCVTFSQTFALPTSVGAGQYRIRGTDSSKHIAISQALLTVGGPSITGIAECPNAAGAEVPLAGGTVQLFSGSVLVGQTTADANGKFSFTGAATGAVYQLRYTSSPSSGVQLSCATTADTTNGLSIPPPPVCLDQSWGTAALLTPAGTTDSICKPNQSIWRKIAVQPGQQVSLVVGNVGPHTRIALFKDLQADFKKLLSSSSTVNVQQLDASMNGLNGSPWGTSALDGSPWGTSPWGTSPWGTSPWGTSPWGTSPWGTSPFDTTQLCQSLGLTATSDQCAGGYVTVQVQDLLAWSANGQIIKNTFDLSGNLYVRIYNDDASFDTSRTLQIQGTALGTCGVPPEPETAAAKPLIKTPSASFVSPTSTTLPGGKKTLIFTDTARLLAPNGKPLNDPSNAAALTAFMTTVNNFAAFPAVSGLVVDLAADTGLRDDYAQWDTPPFPSCPAAANVVSSALHDLINAYRTQSGPSFQYVTILGGHTVIPYHLTPDTAELEQENDYDPGLIDVSKSAGSLGNAYTMTDNYYISFTPMNRVESEISLPDANMAVGRIVEFPADITAVLQDFLDNKGVAHPTSALVTGYTFFTDLANFEATQLSQAGVSTDSLISDTWTAPDLLNKLLGPATPDILAINWHAESNEAVAADYATAHPTTISSSDIYSLPSTDTRFRNTLIMSIGCHMAYPLLDPDVIANPTSPPQFVTDARSFTEAFQGRGAMVLGNSGFGYGDTDFMGYSEQLMALITQELTNGAPSTVPVGLALTNAKRKYIQESGATTGVDKKSLEELTFYGPPMWSIGLPARVAKPTPNTLSVNPVVADAAHSLAANTVSPPYTLTQKQQDLGGNAGSSTYFEADHQATDQAAGKQEIPYRATLPFKGFDISAPAAGVARGVALVGADYVDLPNQHALVDVPATEEPGTRPQPWQTKGFWPDQTYGINSLSGQELVTTPLQWNSGDGLTGTIREYANSAATTLRVYYSNLTSGAAFAGPASINDVSLSSNSPTLHVDVTVSGASAADVFDVLVDYTVPPAPGSTGHWLTCSLIGSRTNGPTTTASCPNASLANIPSGPGSFARHYTGDIDPSAFPGAGPGSLLIAIQVVTGTGLVSTRDNDGQFFNLVQQTATITNPKAKTSITIGAFPAPITYGLNSTFTAHLLAASGNCSVVGNPPALTFNFGSQVQTVPTDASGNASATFNIQEVPNKYPLIVSFAETTTCLGSTAVSADLSVQKEPTNLVFSTTTPYAALLTDANGTPMRSRFVYFTFSNAAGTVNATRAAETDANGIAQLRGMTVPAGTYTVTVSFPGTIPTSGGVLKLSNPFYLPSQAQGVNVPADVTAPTCTLSNIIYNASGVATSLTLTVQDSGSGLSSVTASGLPSGAFSAPSFTTGQTTPLVATVNLTQNTSFSVHVVDVAGNATDCDTELVQVGRTTTLPRRERTTLGDTETATIFNGNPGVQMLQIKVNNQPVSVKGLQPGEIRTVDLSSLVTGNNDSVIVSAQGSPGGNAVVIFSDNSIGSP
jgi:hypothetical protein